MFISYIDMNKLAMSNYTYFSGLCVASIGVPFLVCNLWKKIFKKLITDKENKIVVITGCDSGIGLHIAERMLVEGFTVVATVISKQSYGGKLLSTQGAIVQVVNYPRYEDIDALEKIVEEQRSNGKKLHCLVNNAGVMVYGKSNWYTPQCIQNQIEVNLTGTIMMTRALIQDIIYDNGRIVNISSTMGVLASPMLSVYCATKAGLEAYTNSIRKEGIKVVLIRPCNLPLQTCIMANSINDLRKMKKALNDVEYADTVGPQIDEAVKGLNEMFKDYSATEQRRPLNDYRLIKSINDAVLLEKPQNMYTAAPFLIKLLLTVCSISPDSVTDFLFRYNIPFYLLALSSS